MPRASVILKEEFLSYPTIVPAAGLSWRILHTIVRCWKAKKTRVSWSAACPAPVRRRRLSFCLVTWPLWQGPKKGGWVASVSSTWWSARWYWRALGMPSWWEFHRNTSKITFREILLRLHVERLPCCYYCCSSHAWGVWTRCSIAAAPHFLECSTFYSPFVCLSYFPHLSDEKTNLPRVVLVMSWSANFFRDGLKLGQGFFSASYLWTCRRLLKNNCQQMQWCFGYREILKCAVDPILHQLAAFIVLK